MFDSEGNITFVDEKGKDLPGHNPAKQSFKDQCDINKIVKKAAVTGSLSHINKYSQQYVDLSGFEYEDAMNKIAETNSMFFDLPAELRQEFGGKPENFLSFLRNNTPDEIREKMPALAAPGRQLPDVIGGGSALPPSAAGASTGGEAAAGVVDPNTAPQGAEKPAEAGSGTVT